MINYHFVLTYQQAAAIIELANNSAFKERHPFGIAATRLDEQIARQDAPWERCSTCRGSGWVEGGE